MNGAETLVRTLVHGGVKFCFANPGTSEMHFVAALDKVEGMRCVLGLFEGVCTGAADGYARMLDRPAATLLHLGPGLANGLANIHNARRASSPMVNIVGEHATYHRALDAPLTSDIEGIARAFSHWVKISPNAASVAADAAAAIAAARTEPGHIATLILPADTAWEEANNGFLQGIAPVPPFKGRSPAEASAVRKAAELLRTSAKSALFLGDSAVQGEALEFAGRIARKSGARLIARTFNRRMERGAGRVSLERLPYQINASLDMLKGVDQLILVGAQAPVAFFAYPNKPSLLSNPDGIVHVLTDTQQDSVAALAALADELDATGPALHIERCDPGLPSGPITLEGLGTVLASLIPENAIIVDEANTSGRLFFNLTRAARPHDFIQNMGGSIGYGLPVSVGAALACPDRQVICLEGDGSAMYTLQALWTQARESLKITTVLFSNRGYRILVGELANIGVTNPGPKALSMFDLDNPCPDWIALAGSLGVPGRRVTNLGEMASSLHDAFKSDGPFFIEVVM